MSERDMTVEECAAVDEWQEVADEASLAVRHALAGLARKVVLRERAGLAMAVGFGALEAAGELIRLLDTASGTREMSPMIEAWAMGTLRGKLHGLAVPVDQDGIPIEPAPPRYDA